MKDHLQSCHLTKFGAFGVNRDDVVASEKNPYRVPKNHINSFIFF